MSEAPNDLETILDLSAEEVTFIASLPVAVESFSFAQLMKLADRIARSRAGAEQAIRGFPAIQDLPAAAALQSDLADLTRIEFRLRAWWGAIETELRRRCDDGRAGPQK